MERTNHSNPHHCRHFSRHRRFLPQLTRTGPSRQLTTNVGGIFSSCIPHTLDNYIKPPPVCTLVLTRGGRFQRDTRDSLSSPNFIAALELFLLITHDVRVILRRLTKMFWVFIASCVPGHPTTTSSLSGVHACILSRGLIAA